MGLLNRKQRPKSSDKWVVFDFDGTIAETNQLLIDFFNAYIEPHFNCPKISVEDIEKLRDLNISEKMKYLQIPFHQLPSVIRRCRKNFRSFLTNLPIVPGLPEQFVKFQEQGYKLAIISSNRKKNIQECLKLHDITVFETIFCDKGRSLFVKHKTIKKFLKTANINHDQMVYVGDECRDVSACHRVKVPMVAVSWGWDSHKRLSTLASEAEIADTPDELFTKACTLLGK